MLVASRQSCHTAVYHVISAVQTDMKIWALVLLVGVLAHAAPFDQRSEARGTHERNIKKLSDFSAENDLYTLFSADEKDVPVNVVVADKVETLDEQLTITLNLEDSFENTIDADEEHTKFKRDLSNEENFDKDETSVEDHETENTSDHSGEDLDSEEVESARVKRDLEDDDVALPEYEDDWPGQMEDGRDENMVERNLHDAVEDWPVDLVKDDQFIVSDERAGRVERGLEEENDDGSTEEEEIWKWFIREMEAKDEDNRVKRAVEKDNSSESSESSEEQDVEIKRVVEEDKSSDSSEEQGIEIKRVDEIQ